MLTIHPNQVYLNWHFNMPAELVNSILLEFDKDKLIELRKRTEGHSTRV